MNVQKWMRSRGIVLLVLLAMVLGAPNSYGGTCVATNICTAWCMYTISTGQTLAGQCSPSGLGNNGGCLACDPLLFTYEGGFCIPHLFNSEAYQIYYYFASSPTSVTTGSSILGYPGNTGALQNTMVQLVTGLSAHYAVRIRFGVFFYSNGNSLYYYPLNYSMDVTSYTYNQQNYNYFSCYDIVTSPLQTHFNNNVTITFLNTNTSMPMNTAGCTYTTCQCGNGCGPLNCGCGVQSFICCDNRYIQIRDMIVFASLCPSNCATCASATICTSCTGANYLNYADKLCYSSCPQATYANTTMILVGNAGSGAYPGYGQVFQTYCVACNVLCMQCTNSTVCTRCYTIGQNESYLFNNTCVAAPCPDGYFANMTNHTCDCPQDNYYSIVTAGNAMMICIPCAFQCLKCSGSTNLLCSACMPNFYLSNGTSFCLTKCPDGQFIDSGTQACYLCDISCSSCDSVATHCTQCYTNTVRYLFEGLCLTWCPLGYSWNNITRTCDLCTFYTYSYLGACVTVCPNMYQANLYNRSCISLSQTGFQFILSLQEIHVLPHGKLLQYTILAQDGLNNTSQTWMLYNSYTMVQVLYTDSQLNSFVGVRSLMNVTLPIQNIYYQNKRITYTTQLPSQLNYHKSFQVVFLNTLYSSQDITYSNYSTVYDINQHPELMNEYYSYSVTNYFNLLMVPFLVLLAFLFFLQVKGAYELYIEAFRVVQTLGLLIYSSYPIGGYTFYFLVGCSYSNLDFIPNIYAMLVTSDSSEAIFASYFLDTPDMDFIRLMGSVVLFALFMLFTFMITKYLLAVKETRLDFIACLTIDLMEVKIFHSFWSSLLYIISNYQATEFGMFIIFVLASCFLGGVIGRRYWIWKETLDFSPFFIWRAASTLTICFISMGNEIVISVIMLVSMGVTLWQFFSLHSNKYLMNINDLNSSNYMEERTYKVLNSYDMEVGFSFSIPIRNIITTLCPVLTSVLSGVLILLKDAETYSVLFTVSIIYILTLILFFATWLIYRFLQERRKFLVQNKLEYLQKKYAKLGAKDTQIYEQRRRPRVATTSINFDDQKNLEYGMANRSMMKSFD